MDIVIPITILVLGCGLVVLGSAIRLGVVRLLPAFNPDEELVSQISRGGLPVVAGGILSLGTGTVQWYAPLPTVGWLAYTLVLIALLFLGAARVGGS